jgi:signal transduction histidine kinase
VLIVEDSETDAKLVLREIRRTGLRVEAERVENADSMRAALEGGPWDLVISDWSLPRFGALAALEELKRAGRDIPFIIVSGTVDEEMAVEAMRAGASDFVLKDKPARLVVAVERELRESRIRDALRRSEEQLRQAQKMEAIGRLAGGVAHDFNNSLSVILTVAELVLDDLQPDDPKRTDLEDIHKAARQAADLTLQLLTFSRQKVIEERVVDLNEVLTTADSMLRRILGEDIDVVSLPGGRLGRVRVDPGGIEQLIMNLAVNARDAMPTGGKLTLETANVILDEDYARSHLGVEAGPHVMLAISDTGIGMDSATQARIFEPFFTTKEKGRGTGLGLSTVFGIVRQSRGSIWVYSEQGTGTTFKVYFPRVDEPVDVLVPRFSPATLRGSETILLVEDNDQVRAAARSILRTYGYEVLDARSTRDARAHCDKHQGAIHLLLTDVVMPEMSGPELAQRLLEVRRDMRVLYMSGYTDDSIVRHGVLRPTVAYVQKPITPETLTRKVREVLGQVASVGEQD